MESLREIFAPYRKDDQILAMREVDGVMRAYRATVRSVAEEGSSWYVQTSHGNDLVNVEGVGGNLMPIDQATEEQLQREGDGFEVERRVGPPDIAEMIEIEQWLHEHSLEGHQPPTIGG